VKKKRVALSFLLYAAQKGSEIIQGTLFLSPATGKREKGRTLFFISLVRER